MTVATGNEVQTVTVNGAPSGGSFTLKYGADSPVTINQGATASAAQTALAASPSIGNGNVSVTGSAGGPYTITFQGALRDRNVATLVADASGLTGGTSPSVAVITVTQGDTPVNERSYCDISAGGTVANLELLVGQAPPPGALLVDASDYYGNG